MFKRKAALALASALILAAPAAASAQKLTLHPNGFGQKSQAAWKAKQGEADSRGNANHALYFQKFVPTATIAAGVATVNGIAGQALTGLSWEHRDDGHCGAGAPRWNVYTVDSGGGSHTYFLGCAAAVHSPGSETGWTKDTFVPPVLAPGETVTGLQIVFDEGTDQGPGFVFLDNIQVNDQTWTSPADNGNGG
jgi:hypothetical protein